MDSQQKEDPIEDLRQTEAEFRLTEVGARTHADSSAWERARSLSQELTEMQRQGLQTHALVDAGVRKNAETAILLSASASQQAQAVTTLGDFLLKSMEQLRAPPPPLPKTGAMDVLARVLEKATEQVGGAFKGRGPELLQVLTGVKMGPAVAAAAPPPAGPPPAEDESCPDPPAGNGSSPEPGGAHSVPLDPELASMLAEVVGMLPPELDGLSIHEFRQYLHKAKGGSP